MLAQFPPDPRTRRSVNLDEERRARNRIRSIAGPIHGVLVSNVADFEGLFHYTGIGHLLVI